MVKLNEKYVTNRAGQRTDVVLSRKDYSRLMEYLEDLEDRLKIRQRKRNAKFVLWKATA
jgi:PHD/YefM family antitoxin component YafN of YafNO toxin-antitoxin module